MLPIWRLAYSSYFPHYKLVQKNKKKRRDALEKQYFI